MGRINDVCQRIAEVRGATTAEIAAQLRVWKDREDWFLDKARDALFVSIMEALDRLAARTGADDTNLLALVAQWREASDKHKRVVHEHSVAEETTATGSDPDGEVREGKVLDAVAALEKRIMRSVPAATVAGLAAKLEIAFDITGAMPSRREKWSTEDWTAWSCWQDAKRLVAGD